MKKKYTIQESIDIIKRGELNFTRNQYQLLYENYETQICNKGYLQYRLNTTDKWKNVHSLVNIFFNHEEHNIKYNELVKTGLEKCLVTHHKGVKDISNKLNNHPDNLQWMGKQEHIKYHYKLNDINKINLQKAGDKIWNIQNEEYGQFEKQRTKIINSVTKTITEHNENFWSGKEAEIHKKNYSEKMKVISKKLWQTEEFKQLHDKQLFDLWHGVNSVYFRKTMILKLSGPEAIFKKNQNKVFNIFNKILGNNDNITENTYAQYKTYKNAPHPKTIFGSIENAIENYKNYIKNGH